MCVVVVTRRTKADCVPEPNWRVLKEMILAELLSLADGCFSVAAIWTGPLMRFNGMMIRSSNEKNGIGPSMVVLR